MMVWLARRVGHEHKRDEDSSGRGGRSTSAWYVRLMDLPCPPFVGLAIAVHEGGDPVDIEEVFISERGGLVCSLQQAFYHENECAWEDWPEQLEYHTQGWLRLGDDFDHDRLPEAREGATPVDRDEASTHRAHAGNGVKEQPALRQLRKWWKKASTEEKAAFARGEQDELRRLLGG